jgi:hypothetical protein
MKQWYPIILIFLLLNRAGTICSQTAEPLLTAPPFQGVKKGGNAGSNLVFAEQWVPIETMGVVMAGPDDEAEHKGKIETPAQEKWYQKQYNYMAAGGKLLSAQWYTEAGVFIDGLAKVKYNGLYGYINTKGEIIIAFNCLDASLFVADRALLHRLDESWCVVDKKGNIVDSIIAKGKHFKNYGNYILIGSYSESFLLDTNFMPVFPNRYKQVLPFNDTLFIVRTKEKKVGIVTISGKTVLEPVYDNIQYEYHSLKKESLQKKLFGEADMTSLESLFLKFNEDNYPVAIQGKNQYLLNEAGEIIAGPYRSFDRKSYGYRIKQNGKEGAIDMAGKIIFEPIYNAVMFEKELGKFKLDTYESGSVKTMLADRNGRIIIPNTIYFGSFIKGNAVGNIKIKGEGNSFDKRTYGIIDTSGKWIVPAVYDYIDYYSDENNGCYLYEIKNRFGLFNEDGKVILEGFKYLGMPGEGLIAFSKNGKSFGYMSMEGKVIIEPEYQSAEIFKNGKAAVTKKGKIYSINKSGEILEERK